MGRSCACIARGGRAGLAAVSFGETVVSLLVKSVWLPQLVLSYARSAHPGARVLEAAACCVRRHAHLRLRAVLRTLL